MFRVSSHQVYLGGQSYMMGNSTRLNELHHKINTEKEVENPSDDPVAKRRIMHEDRLLQETGCWEKNIGEARSQLEGGENALRTIHETLDAVKTLTLRMANDTTATDDRRDARDQVVKAMEDIVAAGNTEIDGYHLFGGYRTGREPFLSDGTYRGDDAERLLELSPGLTKQVAFPGSRILTGTVGGGTNVFTTLTTLAEALLADDTEAIQDRIDELDASLEQVSAVMSETGSLIKEVELSDAVLKTNELQSKIRKSALEDLDVSKALTDFKNMKTTLETTMATTAEVLGLSLLSYLK